MINKIITKGKNEIQIGIVVNNRCDGHPGFPECHCNDCITEIREFAGYKINKEYEFRGVIVEITSFCPLDSCADIFIQGKTNPGFCEWITLEEARNHLNVL
jgi:hypothetical protein